MIPARFVDSFLIFLRGGIHDVGCDEKNSLDINPGNIFLLAIVSVSYPASSSKVLPRVSMPSSSIPRAVAIKTAVKRIKING